MARRPDGDPLRVRVLAAASLAALTTALTVWADGEGREHLPTLVDRAFEALRAQSVDERRSPLAVRSRRLPVPEEDIAEAEEDLDNSGVIPLLQEFVHLRLGRDRNISSRSWLVGAWLCCQLNGGRLVLERLTDVLSFRLSPAMLQRLEVPDYIDDDKGFEAAYGVVRSGS